MYVLGELPGQADVFTAHGACAAGFDPLIQTPRVELVLADRGVVAPCLAADTAFRALVGAHERWECLWWCGLLYANHLINTQIRQSKIWLNTEKMHAVYLSQHKPSKCIMQYEQQIIHQQKDEVVL